MRTAGLITLMCGFPGSGKTTSIKNMPYGSVICPDEYRMALLGKSFFRPAEDFVWGAVKLTARVMAGIQRNHIYIDACHLTEGSRAQWIRLADEIGSVIRCYHVSTDWETCVRRNNDRPCPVPQSEMDRMREIYVPPLLKEGFYTVLELTGCAEGE